MGDVVGALVRHEEPEGRRHQFADVVERARTRGPHQGFQFREGHLDRIEVGTVGRQKSELRARGFDRRAHLGLLMDGEVVEHDDIAPSERGHEDLLDVGAERDGVDRAIEDRRGRQLGGAERGDYRVRLPMAARGVIRNARPARASRIAA